MIMLKLTMVLAVTTVAVALGAGAADARQGSSLSCETLSFLSDNPDGVLIANKHETGSFIPAGKVVTWRVEPSGQTGTVTLTDGMKPGETLYLANVLRGPASGKTDCVIV
jgi:hypothetical protein